MTKAYLAMISMEIYGEAEEGDEYYHEVYLRKGAYEITMESEDEDVDLDFYITDEDDETLYEDESEDSSTEVVLQVHKKGVFRFFIKAYGDAEYTIMVEELEEE